MNILFKKLNNKRALIITALIAVIIVIGIGLPGCSTSSYKGWSGVAVVGDNLYIGAQNGTLVGINSANRTKLFNTVILNLATSGGLLSCSGGTISMYVYGTPVVVNNVIYVGGSGGLAFAISADKGIQQWKYPTSGFIGAVIGGLTYDNGNLYFGDNNGKVYALNSQNGSLVWNKPFVTGDKIWGTPVISNGILLVPSFDKKIYALNAADGSLKWSFPTQGAILNTPIIQNGIAYFGSLDRYFYAVDVQTGNLVWKTPEAAGKWFWANPVLINNSIYAPNLDGNVYVINSASGQIATTIKLGYPISSTPTVVGNNLFVAEENGSIWSIDTNNNTAKSVIDYKKNIYAPLSSRQNDVYVLTTDNNLHAFNTENGLDLWGPVPLN